MAFSDAAFLTTAFDEDAFDIEASDPPAVAPTVSGTQYPVSGGVYNAAESPVDNITGDD